MAGLATDCTGHRVPCLHIVAKCRQGSSGGSGVRRHGQLLEVQGENQGWPIDDCAWGSPVAAHGGVGLGH